MDSIDLRAHISASASRDADKIYQVQARAYLAFSTTKTISLSRAPAVRQASTAQQGEKAEGLNSAGDKSSSQQDNDLPTLYIKDTQAARIALDSQLFTLPAIVPRTSSSKRVAETPLSRTSQSRIDRNGSSSISDEAHTTSSSHLKTPIFHRSPKRQRIHSPPRPAKIDGRVHSVARPQVQGEQHASSGQLMQQHSSELPTTYSLSDITTDRSKNKSSLPRSLSDPGPDSSPSLERTTSSPLAARPRFERRRTVAFVEDLGRETTDIAKIGIHTKDQVDDPRDIQIIKASRPKVSMRAFQSHMTDKLREIAQAPLMTGLYRAQHITRELRPSERGHWLFSHTDWTADLQASFWSFMQDFISGGRAGWGVWCISTPSQTDKNEYMVTTYCWGEIIEHIYLLLYIASRSKIRKLGLQWIDAAGEVVIQMPSR